MNTIPRSTTMKAGPLEPRHGIDHEHPSMDCSVSRSQRIRLISILTAFMALSGVVMIAFSLPTQTRARNAGATHEGMLDNSRRPILYHRILEDADQDEEKEYEDVNGENDGGEEYEGAEEVVQDDDEDGVINDDFYAFPEDPVLTLLPVTGNEYLGFALTFLCVILASAGGVGGGGMILPIFLMIMNMPASIASPLTAVTVLGAAVASTLFNSQIRHPLADRPIIDWDIIIVMLPVILVGTLSGTILHQIMSNKVLLVLLVVLLASVSYRTLKKGRKIYNAEREYIAQLKENDGNLSVEASGDQWTDYIAIALARQAMQAFEGFAAELGGQENDQQMNNGQDTRESALLTEMTEEEKFAPRYKIMAICGIFALAVFFNAMLGGGAFPSPWGIRCGSMLFWMVHVVTVSTLLAFAWAAHVYVVNRHEIKELANYDFVIGDVRWDTHGAFLCFLFLLTGFMAGILGIGGGMLTVPIMLDNGVHPEVAAATSSCMILFTAAASTASYAVFGLIHWDYAVVCTVIGFGASLLGKISMKRMKRDKINGIKLKRESFIAFTVGGVLLLSGILLCIKYIFMIGNVVEDDVGGLCYDSRL